MDAFKGFLKLINWPTNGIKDFKGFQAYLTNNWQTLLIVIIGAILLFWIVKKIIGWVFSLLKG